MAHDLKPSAPDSAALERAAALVLKARQTAGNLSSGRGRGNFKNYADECTGHRETFPGDRLRPARKRRLFPESEKPVYLLIDGSDSMKFASGDLSKFACAQQLAASLALLFLQRGDAVGVGFFDEKIEEPIFLARAPEDFPLLAEKLAARIPQGVTRIGESIRDLSEKMVPGARVILLSDFFEEEDTWDEAVERLRFLGNEVVLLHVMDSQEIEFPFQGEMDFQDLEGLEKIALSAGDVRAAYLAEMKHFLGKLRESAARSDGSYLLVDSSKPAAGVLESCLLWKRQARFV